MKGDLGKIAFIDSIRSYDEESGQGKALSLWANVCEIDVEERSLVLDQVLQNTTTEPDLSQSTLNTSGVEEQACAELSKEESEVIVGGAGEGFDYKTPSFTSKYGLAIGIVASNVVAGAISGSGAYFRSQYEQRKQQQQ